MVVGLAVAVAIGACGTATTPSSASRAAARVALIGYVNQIEPIRLAVNRLLTKADQILRAYRRHRLTAGRAAARMDGLERRFANDTVTVAAIEPRGAELQRLQSAYAETYVLEDAYLSALVAGLGQHELGHLPDSQAAQRATIIAWRTGLAVLARRRGVKLPPDLQQAGRGEIAPSPAGS